MRNRIIYVLFAITVMFSVLSATVISSSAASSGYYYNQLNEMEKKIYDVINSSVIGSNISIASATPWNELVSLDMDKTWKNVTAYRQGNSSVFDIDKNVDAEANAYIQSLQDSLAPAIFALTYDVPELSWLVNIQFQLVSYKTWDSFLVYAEDKSATTDYHVYDVAVRVAPTYASMSATTGNLHDVRAVVNKIKATLGTYPTRYDTVKAFYDYICNTVNYAQSDINNRNYQTVYSSMISSSHTTVCAGYARLFKLLCNEYGIPCVLISGTGRGNDHMWNYVQMEDGKWYAVDTTWGDRSWGINYDYLLVGADQLYYSDSSQHVPLNQWDDQVSFNYPELSKASYTVNHTHTGKATYTSNGNGTHSVKYTCCHGKSAPISCSGGTATCTSKAVCSVCHGEYGSSLSHSADYKVVASGSKIDLNCTNCGQAQKSVELNAPKNVEYDGVEKKVSVSSSVGDLAVSYEDSQGNPIDRVVNAGSYTAKVTYEGQTAVLSFSVIPKNIASSEASLSLSRGEYNGEAHAVSVSVGSLVENTDYTVTFPENMTDCGEKNIKVMGMGNYKGTVDLTYVIEKITPEVSDFEFIAPADLQYDGSEKTAIIALKDSFVIPAELEIGYYMNGRKTSPVLPGVYTVRVNVIGNDNCNGKVLTDGSWKFTVTSKDITVTAADQTVSVGDLVDLSVSKCSAELIDGHTISSVHFEHSSTESATNNGTITPSAVVITDSEGNDVTHYYNITYKSGTLSVKIHRHSYWYCYDGEKLTASCSDKDGLCKAPVCVLPTVMADAFLNGEKKSDGGVSGYLCVR